MKLTCTASSEPPATYTWTFNGTQKDVTTAVYKVEKTVYSNSGNYECVATNNVTGKNATAVHRLSVEGEKDLLNNALSVVHQMSFFEQ